MRPQNAACLTASRRSRCCLTLATMHASRCTSACATARAPHRAFTRSPSSPRPGAPCPRRRRRRTSSLGCPGGTRTQALPAVDLLHGGGSHGFLRSAAAHATLPMRATWNVPSGAAMLRRCGGRAPRPARRAGGRAPRRGGRSSAPCALLRLGGGRPSWARTCCHLRPWMRQRRQSLRVRCARTAAARLGRCDGAGRRRAGWRRWRQRGR